MSQAAILAAAKRAEAAMEALIVPGPQRSRQGLQ